MSGNNGWHGFKERKCKKCGLNWFGRIPCPNCSKDRRMLKEGADLKEGKN